jgi:catechol 2,3-dioxygenase-like lactoylglutathione lyase family enzyme
MVVDPLSAAASCGLDSWLYPDALVDKRFWVPAEVYGAFRPASIRSSWAVDMAALPTAIRRVATLEVGVPDPEATATFFEECLDFARHDEPDGRIALTVDGEYGVGRPPSVLTLRQNEALALDAVVLEVGDRQGLDHVTAGLENSGHAVEGISSEEIWFEAPQGVPLICRVAHERSRQPLPPSTVRPRRLGHINLKVPDARQTCDFFMQSLGFSLSEQVGDLLAFLRVSGDHHNIGLRGGEAVANVHHVAMEVPGWDNFLVICDYIAAKGHVIEYGPGRHAPGHNLFLYVREPTSGLRMELFADMARIDDAAAYKPQLWERQDRPRTVNKWGPAPPASFFE